MPKFKFIVGDLVIGREDGRASFRGRVGIVVEHKSSGEYGVKFEDTGIREYVNSTWIELFKRKVA